jgi:hypothetical protein
MLCTANCSNVSKGFLAREGILNVFNSVQMVNMFLLSVGFPQNMTCNVVKNFKVFFVSMLCLCSINYIFLAIV